MAIEYDSAIGFRSFGNRASYAAHDVSLYALSLGFGADPLDEAALDFVLETRGPRTLPTMASVLVRSIARELGLDMRGVLHAAQRLEILAPLPPCAEIEWDAAVTGIADKGPGSGAIVTFDTTGRIADGGEPLFVLGNTVLARGDGGCGGPNGPSPKRRRVPDRAPDLRHAVRTRPDQALLYRLNGDLNPLHSEPTCARAAGFGAPILHGLCTYGIACRAVVETVCAHEPSRIRGFDARFTAPVYPGEEIVTEIWIDADRMDFRCCVPERDATVIDGGECRLGRAATAPRKDERECMTGR